MRVRALLTNQYADLECCRELCIRTLPSGIVFPGRTAKLLDRNVPAFLSNSQKDNFLEVCPISRLVFKQSDYMKHNTRSLTQNVRAYHIWQVSLLYDRELLSPAVCQTCRSEFSVTTSKLVYQTFRCQEIALTPGNGRSSREHM